MLSTGSRLGPYEILAPLGAGGMGEVYRARDTRLGREVAVKVLPEEFARDPERLRRFEGEARAASALSDPHIVTVFDVGEENGIHYFASELVEGSDLRRLLDGGTLPLKKVLDLAEQVASGLAAAHEKGIVHRDLKPENILTTKVGLAKIADFGLAKLTESHAESISQLPTFDGHQTSAGEVMGTVSYMSPEQARGQAVDFRSDQFSLGVVFYEMLTGKRPFRGASAAETLAAIIREEPGPIATSNPQAPAPLRWAIERCLAKDPEDRYASTKDLARDLKSLRDHISEAASTAGTATAKAPLHRRRVPHWALAAAVALAFALGLLVGIRLVRTGPPSASPLSLSLSFPVDAAPVTNNMNPLALTPDGKTLVYAGASDSGSKLFVRRLDRDEIRPIPGTEGARHQFVSPDGLEVGFFAEGKLKKVSLSGGSPVTLCDAPWPRGGWWGADGTIVFTPSAFSGLWRIPATGGAPRRVTTPDGAKSERHYFPQILPDEEHILFAVMDRDFVNRAAVVSLRTGEQRILMEDAAYPRYLPTGHLLFTRPGTLFAVPFNLKLLKTAGASVPLLDDLVTNSNYTRSAEFAFSQGGTLVNVPTRQLQRTLVWVDRKGTVERVPFPPGGYQAVALSPDGTRLAAITVDKGEKMEILFGDFARGLLSRSTAEGTFQNLAWSPDGTRVAFGYAPSGKGLQRVYWQSADGSSPPERLTGETAGQQETASSFSPDGSLLLVHAANYREPTFGSAGWDIFLLPLSRERTLRPLLQTKFQELHARFSPDGRWVAYDSNESGRQEVFVRPFPGPGAKWQISAEGGYEPYWSRSGRELFFRNGDRTMAVDVETPSLRPGRPKTLFDGVYCSGSGNSYDVASDGTRFLMIKPDPEESGPTHVNVVLNWFEEVKRRVPGSK